MRPSFRALLRIFHPITSDFLQCLVRKEVKVDATCHILFP